MSAQPLEHPSAIGPRGELPEPLRLYLEAQPRRIRMFDSSYAVLWCNREGDAASELRFPGSRLAGATIPERPEVFDRWPVTRVMRGEARASRLYTSPQHTPGGRRPEFRTWRVTAWPIHSPHGMLVVEETEPVDIPDEEANRLLQLDRNIEDLLHGVLSRLQQGLDFQSLRLPNPHLNHCVDGSGKHREHCPNCGDHAQERCWELTRTPAEAPASGVELVERFEACSRCNVFSAASPDPMVRISENFNRLISLLQLKFQEELDVQQRLQQADKLAIMGELLASIAHEIKNPLGIIIGRLDIVGLEIESMSTDELAEDLNTIYGQANRVRQIIDHMLRMARPEPPEFRPVLMNSVISDSLSMARRALADRKVRVLLDLDPELPAIPADLIQMQQVLLNLILNARDAMEDGGTLTISSGRNPLDPEEVLVTVADTGEGIAPDRMRSIFASFHTTKLGKGGTGLGLAVCQRILRSHRGRIAADSEVGKGTTMSLFLPAEKDTL